MNLFDSIIAWLQDRRNGYVKVHSSMIKGFKYEPRTLTLEVKFNNGRVYQYQGVPRDIYDELVARDQRGESVGKWFSANVRAVYRFKEIR